MLPLAMQLSGDENLLSLDDALALVARFEPTAAKPTETQPLAQCYGRLLACDIRAPRDVPHFANAAVDGFAFAFDDLKSQATTKLTIGFEIASGKPPQRGLKKSEAARVYTGAALPEGADSVAMEEDVRIEKGIEEGIEKGIEKGIKEAFVHIPQGLRRGANRREAGDDIQSGTLLLTKGHRLDATSCAVLASLGVRQVELLPRLRVALFSSGAEIKGEDASQDGSELGAAQIFDSNAVLLRHWLLSLGCEVVEGGILPDDPDSIIKALDATLQQQSAKPLDLLLSSGGMSQSRLDGIARLLSKQRAFAFWRVALKPGRPVGIGTLRLPSASTPIPFAGLPGNPVACFLTFGLLVQPLIRRLSLEQPFKPRRILARLGFAGKKKRGRREFLRTKIVSEKDGNNEHHEICLPVLAKHGKSGAGVLSSLLEAHGFAELDEETTDYNEGDIVDFLPMREILPR